MLNGPKYIKYKKTKKGKLKKFEFKSNSLKFGTIGLKAAESGIINSKQIEAARRAITRKIKRKGKVWIKVFPYLPVTSKPAGVRMGKGKGNITHWGARVQGGNVLFEICGISHNVALSALKTGGAKLPVKTKIFN
jgi:large subunit ribosomal protein L16